MDTQALKKKIKASPVQSAGLGLAAVYLLTRLPVVGILGLAVRVALAVVRPSLLVLGGAKALDLIKARRAEVSQALPENHY